MILFNKKMIFYFTVEIYYIFILLIVNSVSTYIRMDPLEWIRQMVNGSTRAHVHGSCIFIYTTYRKQFVDLNQVYLDLIYLYY